MFSFKLSYEYEDDDENKYNKTTGIIQSDEKKKRITEIYILYTELKQSRMIQWYSFYTQESLENNPDCNGDFTGLDINVLNDNDHKHN